MVGLKPRLGEFGFNGITSSFAKSVIDEAEGPVRRIIQEERTKVADSMLSGLGWLGASAIALLGTEYLVPKKSGGAKFGGYAAALALAGIGAGVTFYGLRGGNAAAAVTPGETSAAVKNVSDQAALSLVTAAEPRIRSIVDDERARVSDAAQSGLPLVSLGAISAIATALMVDQGSRYAKLAGYSVSVALAAGGAWTALDKVRG